MNKLEILQEQGFPVKQKTFDFMQDAYTSSIGHLCKMYGDNLILWGCNVEGSQRTAGAVVVNGELLPFEKSSEQSKFRIIETVESATYKDGLTLPAYKTRVARCDVNGEYSWSNFKRALHDLPAATTWQSVVWRTGYQDEASYGMFSRIGENGKGLVVGTYERTDGKGAPNSLSGDLYFSGQVFEIAQMGFKPAKTQYVKIFLRTGALPALGWIDTNGILKAQFDKASRGFNVYKEGYVCAEIDLV